LSPQLDILAFEPHYAGVRRSMLEAVTRYSRHRWKIHTLPGRRIERRLTTAARWFAEELSRGEVGHVDAIYSGEAMNLSELLRLTPEIAGKPSAVYFHENQLPTAGDSFGESPAEWVNLNTATAARQIWFNSQFHYASFMTRAGELIAGHSELRALSPLQEMEAKSRLVPPPVDTHFLAAFAAAHPQPRDVHHLLVDAGEGDVPLLAALLAELDNHGERFHIYALGALGSLPRGASEGPPRILAGNDVPALAEALLRCGIFLSLRQGLAWSDILIKALSGGSWPIVPEFGCHGELLPRSLRPLCQHDQTVENIVDRFFIALEERPLASLEEEMKESLAPFDPVAACRLIDERLSQLAG
jgi:hypothetical protein